MKRTNLACQILFKPLGIVLNIYLTKITLLDKTFTNEQFLVVNEGLWISTLNQIKTYAGHLQI